MTGRRLLLLGWACGALALAASCGVEPAREPLARRTAIAATILHSTAPWDDAACELLIPLGEPGQAPRPFLRIEIWGKPEFARPRTLSLSEESGPKGVGHASYQPELDASLPQVLTGTVRFEASAPGAPVAGAFSLSAPDGRRFEGEFRAAWGNARQLPIR